MPYMDFDKLEQQRIQREGWPLTTPTGPTRNLRCTTSLMTAAANIAWRVGITAPRGERR